MKRILTAVAAIVASATPALATGSFDEHKRLYDALHQVGVRVSINSAGHCNGRIDGMYRSSTGLLVVCQDRGHRGGEETDWTDNDLDTLRHEAFHVLQDCADGRRGDSRLVTWHPTEQQTLNFVYSVLGKQEAHSLMQSDSYRIAPRHIKIIEMEAFATARAISPNMISNALLHTCRN